ncbi:MAG TPA: ATP-binding cassette domain-containing protein [Candidatus Binataceae bacterium]|nr:ATP-binding cassette domain-containing protein [Candidatus Binataceae bacterium]
MAPVIQITDLYKIYRLGEIEVRALNGASLTIERGEFVAIMGSSGSGKSTLMNIIGCLDRPTSGRYLLEGIDVASLSEERLALIRSRRIGFIFQNFNLLSRTSALENVELPLFYSAWTAGSATRAAELLEMVGLKGREQNHSNQLSGGQQQRVAIARALIKRPAILLADEPTGNLDSTNSAEIMEIIRRLNREDGITAILVTHDPEVAAYADRVVTFRDGVIVADERRTAHPAMGAAVSAATHALGAGADHDSPETAEPGGGGEAWTFGVMALSAAARALRRNKLRAALTMLGIFIGVAAVIAMVAIGDGARYAVEQQIQSLGTNQLIVLPGATTANGVRAGFGSNSTLTVADADAVRTEARTVEAVSYIDRQVAQVVYGSRNWSTSISGTTPVCVLGQTVINNLFGPGATPIGVTIRVRGYPLRVIGVLEVKGQSNFGQDQDDVILMPFATAERKVLGVSGVSVAVSSATGNGAANPVQNPYASIPVAGSIYASSNPVLSPFGGAPKISGVVNMLFVKARSADLVPAAQAEVTAILHRRHHVNAGQDDDFTVRNLAEIAEASASATRVMTLLLAAVASISLLVGGIGIMNIMLVSVTERTREIGIRMAIGARRLHILLQFLVEALLLSALGGIAGALLGVTISKLLATIAQWPTLVSPASVVGGFLFAAAVGVFFGWYPARKASMLDPIDALRYE